MKTAKRSKEKVNDKPNASVALTSEEFKVFYDKGLFGNHDERDDDDVKYARRDWDENATFGGKMKLSSEDAQGRRLKNFFQIRSVSSQWTSLIHLSYGQSIIGDEEFVILVTLEPGFSFPYEANPEFDFDENAESER